MCFNIGGEVMDIQNSENIFKWVCIIGTILIIFETVIETKVMLIKGKNVRAILHSILKVMAIIFIWGAYIWFLNDHENVIEHVKDSCPISVMHITYGDVIDSLDENAEWKYVKINTDIYHVTCEFNGRHSDGTVDRYKVSFLLDKYTDDIKDRAFKVCLIYKNGTYEMNDDEKKEFLYSLFKEYAKTLGLSIDESAKNNILLSEQYMTEQDDLSDNNNYNDKEKGQNNNDSTLDSGDIVYSNVYMPVLNDYIKDGNYSQYVITDINDDGIKDLIVSYGSYDTGINNKVYTVGTDEKYSYVGEFSGQYSFYENDDGEGVYAYDNSTDFQVLKKITFKNFVKCYEIWNSTSGKEMDVELGKVCRPSACNDRYELYGA